MDAIETAITNSIASLNESADAGAVESPSESVETAPETTPEGSDSESDDTAPVTDPTETPDPTTQKLSESPTDPSKIAEDAAKAAADALDKQMKQLEKGKGSNWLPKVRVRQMVARAREKAAAELHGKLAEHTTRLGDYEARLEKVAQLETIAASPYSSF
ncbi:MAG TPA: hypothetical protein VHJ58_06130 [Vicinamibacterales bacterium]|nr:hypothetical protein [Vicinamibacterales bacterium]